MSSRRPAGLLAASSGGARLYGEDPDAHDVRGPALFEHLFVCARVGVSVCARVSEHVCARLCACAGVGV